MEILNDFRILSPATVDEAVRMAAENGGSRFIAGGTDLVPNLRRGLQATPTLVDLSCVGELENIEAGLDGLIVGAGVVLADFAVHPAIQSDYPVLAQAASCIAGNSHRQAGTVGGNICLDTRCVFYNQSEWWRESNDFCLKYEGTKCHVAPKSKICFASYSGDLAPAFMVLGATANLAGPEGSRSLPLEDLFTDDGAAYLALKPGEMLVSLSVPKPDVSALYEKVRVRDSIDFPLAGVAVALNKKSQKLAALRVALTGTNPRPILISGTGEFLGRPLDEAALEKLGAMIQAQVSPMKTTIHTAWYRRRVAGRVASRVAKQLWENR